MSRELRRNSAILGRENLVYEFRYLASLCSAVAESLDRRADLDALYQFRKLGRRVMAATTFAIWFAPRKLDAQRSRTAIHERRYKSFEAFCRAELAKQGMS